MASQSLSRLVIEPLVEMSDKEGLTARDKRWYNREIKKPTNCLSNHFGDDMSSFVGTYGWNFNFANIKCLCDSRVINVQV